MTDKFEAHILPIRHYVRYKDYDYNLLLIQFDIVKDGVSADNGYGYQDECCYTGLLELVETANDFLAGKIKKKRRLNFTIPYVDGEEEQYTYFFDIYVGRKPEDNYWIFHTASDYSAKRRKSKFSCELTREQVAALSLSVARQMEEFDWENYGKTEYFEFSLPDRPYEWCYSAGRLEKSLNDALDGDRLKTIYVSGANYAEPLIVEKNVVTYYVGSRVYLELEKTHADILAYAEGLFQIRLFDVHEVEKTRFYDVLDHGDEVLCDTKYVFDLNYSGEIVKKITVQPTDSWPWPAIGFDKNKLSDPIELPESLHFSLGNRTTLTITGLDDDFMIKMEPDISE